VLAVNEWLAPAAGLVRSWLSKRSFVWSRLDIVASFCSFSHPSVHGYTCCIYALVVNAAVPFRCISSSECDRHESLHVVRSYWYQFMYIDKSDA
jgi:hypothetical protein